MDNDNSNQKKIRKSQCAVNGCTEEMNYLPFRCKYCGKYFCKVHRLPENHDCTFELDSGSYSNSSNFTTNTDSSQEGEEDEYLYDPQSEIPNVYSSETSSYSDNMDDEIDREMRNYIRRQERGRPRTRDVSGVRVAHRTPFITRANKPIATYWIMGISAVLLLIKYSQISIGEFNLSGFFILNIANLKQYFYLPILTSMFVPGGFFDMLFLLLILYGTGKNLETQYGTKFILALYVTGGVLATAGTLLIQGLALIFPQTFSFVLAFGQGFQGVSTQWGAIMAIFTFIIYLAGIEREMRFIIYFIPVQMKGKTMLYILIGINLVYFIGGLLFGFFAGAGVTAATSFGQLCAMYAGKYYYEKFGYRTPIRFF